MPYSWQWHKCKRVSRNMQDFLKCKLGIYIAFYLVQASYMPEHRYKGGEIDSASLVRGMTKSCDTEKVFHAIYHTTLAEYWLYWLFSPHIYSIHVLLFSTQKEQARSTFEIAALPVQPTSKGKGTSSTILTAMVLGRGSKRQWTQLWCIYIGHPLGQGRSNRSPVIEDFSKHAWSSVFIQIPELLP